MLQLVSEIFLIWS